MKNIPPPPLTLEQAPPAPDDKPVKPAKSGKRRKPAIPTHLPRKIPAPSPASLQSLEKAAEGCRKEVMPKSKRAQRTAPKGVEADRKVGMSNFRAVVYGQKYKNGRPLKKWGVTYLVAKKESNTKNIREGALIKKGLKFKGKIDVDVREMRRAIPFASPGDGIGVRNGNKGTFGLLLTKYEQHLGKWEIYALTCNHVASCNGNFQGDEVEFPPPGAGGAGAQYSIGTSAEFVSINESGLNRVDAALVLIYRDSSRVGDLLGGVEDFDTSWDDPAPHMRLVKFGANGKTYGRITGGGTHPIDYSNFGMGLGNVEFSDLLFVESFDAGAQFAAPGDSGAIVFDADTRRPVGMVIGGEDPADTGGTGEHRTFVTPIRSVIGSWNLAQFWKQIQ
jgi:hypothetical protein